ncbi:transposase, partial [Colletotrichum incanum]
SVFSPVKSAYRKELGYLSQWNDSTIIGKRNFFSCYQKARLAGLTAQNIKSGWKYTGLWPVEIAKPLMSSLLLPKASNPPSTPLNKTSQGIQGIQDTQGIDGWASASSAFATINNIRQSEIEAGEVEVDTDGSSVSDHPSKRDFIFYYQKTHLTELTTQNIKIGWKYTGLWLVAKGQKGFQEQFFQLTTVQQEIQLLQAQVRNSAAGKRKAVKVDTNSKFANLSNIRQSYIEADEVEIDTDGSSSSNYPTEDESCI